MINRIEHIGFIFILFIFVISFFNMKPNNVLGISEVAELQSLGLKFDAKVDSGAESSSLHAQDIKVLDNEYVSFTTTNEKGQTVKVLKHIEFKRIIKSASGQKERIFIKENVKIGSQYYQIFMNLADRSHLSKKMLIGKDIIKQGFLIDANKKYLVSVNRTK